MKIVEIWFDADYIYGKDEQGKEYKQSLLWYSKLREASEEERRHYTIGMGGIHWRNLDEDISFESFGYEDVEPSAMQRFFLTHKEKNFLLKEKNQKYYQIQNYYHYFQDKINNQLSHFDIQIKLHLLFFHFLN